MSKESALLYRNELQKTLQQKEKNGEYDFLVKYQPVSMAFPSPELHPQMGALNIDYQALANWANNLGWQANSSLENTSPEEKLTPYIRFIKI